MPNNAVILVVFPCRVCVLAVDMARTLSSPYAHNAVILVVFPCRVCVLGVHMTMFKPCVHLEHKHDKERQPG